MIQEEKKCPKLVLVDGSNYLFRAFYAIRDLSNSKGFPTNAIYGFTTMLMKLLRDQAAGLHRRRLRCQGPYLPARGLCRLQSHAPGRPRHPHSQIPYVKEIVRGFSIPIFEQAGLEADDIIGRSAGTQAQAGMAVVIVSVTRT